MSAQAPADQPQEEVPKGIEGFDVVTKARGIIIDYAVEVEQRLCDVLAQYMTRDQTKKSQFVDFLHSENFTFGMKIKMLSQMDVHRNAAFGSTFKGLTADLMHVMEVRDSLAHQPREPIDPYIVLKVSINGKKTTKSTKMDAEFVLKFVSHAVQVSKKLRALRALLDETEVH